MVVGHTLYFCRGIGLQNPGGRNAVVIDRSDRGQPHDRQNWAGRITVKQLNELSSEELASVFLQFRQHWVRLRAQTLISGFLAGWTAAILLAGIYAAPLLHACSGLG